MAAPTIQGVKFIAGLSVYWGTSAVAPTGIGTITQDLSISEEGETKEIKNSDGNTAEVVMFDEKTVASFTIMMESTVALPDRGDTVSFGPSAAIKGVITKVSKAYKAGEEAYVTIEATKWAAISLT